jgi:hypothetical protein
VYVGYSHAKHIIIWAAYAVLDSCRLCGSELERCRFHVQFNVPHQIEIQQLLAKHDLRKRRANMLPRYTHVPFFGFLIDLYVLFCDLNKVPLKDRSREYLCLRIMTCSLGGMGQVCVTNTRKGKCICSMTIPLGKPFRKLEELHYRLTSTRRGPQLALRRN